ncbi:hypothetical protein G6L37_02425 [Agrobacterium rubi]|nr:hypothetical protein [Agrobacterium rubi]NTF24251.1 hypothetical protein [Agrobacterium rubi]
MVKLNGSNKRSGGNGNKRTSSFKENVLVQVLGVNETNPKAPTKETDTIDAGLLHNAFGLEAKFDNDGNPLTILKARVDVNAKNRYRNPDPAKQPTEMWDLRTGRRKGTGDKMGKAPVVVLEKASLNANGEIEAGFIIIAQRDKDSEKELVIENVLSTVYEETTRGDRKVQERKIYMAEEAVLVESIDALRAAVKEKLEDDRASRPFAIIRVIGKDLEEVDPAEPRYPYEAATSTVYPRFENETNLSAEESFDRWFTDTAKTQDGRPIYQRDENDEIVKDADGQPVVALKNAAMIGFVQDFLINKEEEHDTVMFEVIGGFTYTTGKQSLPSTNGRLSDSVNFQMSHENDETGIVSINAKTGRPYTRQGITRAHMLLGRVEDQEVPGTYGAWYAQKTIPTKGIDRQIFKECEIITPHTPAVVAAAFKEQADRRFEARSEEFKSKNNAPAPKDDDDIPHGDEQPAYDGGMAMGR